jgi:HEAT repeat protein
MISEGGKAHMSASQNELSKKGKINQLKRLIENEDGFSDNQSIYQAYLSDPDPEVRVLAIQGLWDYPDPALVEPLIEIAEGDPEQQVRIRAITTLGRYVYEGETAAYDFDWGAMEDVMREDELPEDSFRRVVAFLLGIAQNPSASPDARRFSIEALGFSSEPEVADLVMQAYHDPLVDVKVSALFAMGRSGLAQWIPCILAELNSPEPRLQLEAVRAAGELFLDEATPMLLHIAQSATDQSLRHEAIWALGHTTPLEAWQLLDDISTDPTEEEETRQIAEAALEEYYMFQEIAEIDYEHDGDDGFEQEEDGGGNGYFTEW